jgi:hypothetical protein
MSSEALTNDDWNATVERLGGRELLEREARETGAFQRAREVSCAVDQLRLTFAYCLGMMGFRSTALWSAAVDLAQLSNVALLKRVRKSALWLEAILNRQLAALAKPLDTALTRDRLIRIVDATVVAKASRAERQAGGVWRVHAVFDLDGKTERFSSFELTDESGGERFDRAAVVAGEIRIGDRAYLQPDRIAAVRAAGGDVLIRAPWNGARWLDAEGTSFDLIALLMKSKTVGIIDQPIWIKATADAPMALRLVAIRKPETAIAETRAKLEAEARKRGRDVQPETLVAAGWVILITSLDASEFPTAAIGELYKLRWRIEIAFKHLKSGLGFKRPPGNDPDIAKAHILSHLLMALMTEPLIAEHLGDSPRRLAA